MSNDVKIIVLESTCRNAICDYRQQILDGDKVTKYIVHGHGLTEAYDSFHIKEMDKSEGCRILAEIKNYLLRTLQVISELKDETEEVFIFEDGFTAVYFSLREIENVFIEDKAICWIVKDIFRLWVENTLILTNEIKFVKAFYVNVLLCLERYPKNKIDRGKDIYWGYTSSVYLYFKIDMMVFDSEKNKWLLFDEYEMGFKK
ncbi:MAG: hypothetical protein ACRCST_11595 [Turicibacter sp.]